MAGRVESCNNDIVTEGQHVTFTYEPVDNQRFETDRQMEHSRLFLTALSQRLIRSMGHNRRMVDIFNMIHTESMVDMNMGQQRSLKLQLFSGNKIVYHHILGIR